MEHFGRYELIKKIATGGMAEIFLARQAGIDGFEKLLVLKRILPHLAENPEFVEMFLHEAKIAVRLTHPNIAQIYDLGAEDDTYFIAMEYIHGDDARRIWKSCSKAGISLPIPLACRIAIDAAAGLYHAHTKCDATGAPLNIVHRDISPQNILVSFEGAVKVTDFGIAKASDQATHTQSGVLKGKYSYMSPEQASGLDVDAKTDQFALGIVLYELLTFQRLFKRANEIQTLTAVSECNVQPPSTINPNIPPELDAIVMRALAKDKENRYPDLQAFQVDLENWLMATRQSSSSALLSNFLKSLYADRLAQEAKEELPAMDPEPSNGADSIVSKRIQRRRSSLIAIPARRSISLSSDRLSRVSRPPSPSRRQALIDDVVSEPSGSSSSRQSKSGSGRRAHPSEKSAKRRRKTEESKSVVHAPQAQEGKRSAVGTFFKLLCLLAVAGGIVYLHLTTPGGLAALASKINFSELAPPDIAEIPSLTPPALPTSPAELEVPAAKADDDNKIQLTIESDPPGADVHYNGFLLGQTPITQSVSRANKASVRIVAPGYVERTEEILLGDGDEKKFKFRLKKKTESNSKSARQDKGSRKNFGQRVEVAGIAASKHDNSEKEETASAPTPAEAAAAEFEAAPKNGVVHVISSPQAKVVDSKNRSTLCAKTPCDFELPPGRHKILIQYLDEGGCVTPRAFTLKSGQELSFDVQRARGQLLVMAQPWADVWLNNKKLGTTPFPKVDLCEGSYKLLLINADLNKKKQVDISIAPNELTKVNVSMEAP